MNLRDWWQQKYQKKDKGEFPTWKTVSTMEGTGLFLMTDGTIAKNLSQVNLTDGDRVLVYQGNILQIDWKKKRVHVPVLFPKRFYIIVADTSNHRIQVFDENYNFMQKWGSLGYDHKPQKFWYPWQIAAYENELYIANSWQGWIDVYDLEGNYQRGHFENKYVLGMAVGEDKIAATEADEFSVYVYIYDMDFNVLAVITKKVGTNEVLAGLAIGDGKLFVSVSESETAKCLRVYDLGNYSLIKTIETGGGADIYYDAGAYYEGKYYGLRIELEQSIFFPSDLLKYVTLRIDVFETLTDKFNDFKYSYTIEDKVNFDSLLSFVSARGLAVNKNGIFVTIPAMLSLGKYSEPKSERVYQYTLDGEYVGNLGGPGVVITSGAVSPPTATNLAANINAYTSDPNYTASANGDVVTISAVAGTGSTPNGYAVRIGLFHSSPDGPAFLDYFVTYMSGGKDKSTNESEVLATGAINLDDIESGYIVEIFTIIDVMVCGDGQFGGLRGIAIMET